MRVRGGGNDHRLADEAVEERESGDRARSDSVEYDDELHSVGDAAELGQLAKPGRVDNGPHPHEQKRFIEDVAEGMRRRPIECEGRTHPHGGHHISDLTDDVIGEKAANVVLENGVDDAVERHRDTRPNKYVRAWKEPQEHVDCGFGRKCAQEDATGHGGFGIGIGQPSVKRRDGGVDGDSEKDQPEGKRVGLGCRQGRDGEPSAPS